MKSRMKKIYRLLTAHWRSILLCLGLAAGLFLLLGYRLGSLTHGVSHDELQTLGEYSSFHAIIGNPLNLPQKLVAWASWHIPMHGAALLRAPSALFGLATLVPFGYILRRWYGVRTAVIGVVLFACSSWFLHVSRSATFDASFLWAIPTLLALHVLLYDHSDKLFVVLTWLAGMLVLLFIPVMVWLLILNLILQHEEIAEGWNTLKTIWFKGGMIILVVLCLAGLGFVFYKHPHLALTWAGVPPHLDRWLDILKRFGNAFAYFIVRGPHNPSLWLGRLPVLDAFMSVMLIAGLIFYGRHITAMRTRLLGLFFIIGAILTALNSEVHFSMLVPIVYVIAVAGIAYLLHEWLRIFPRNPLARSIGIGMVALLVISSSAYNLRSYFVAWPRNTDTTAVFNQTPPHLK
jgi:hypothetical protein